MDAVHKRQKAATHAAKSTLANAGGDFFSPDSAAIAPAGFRYGREVQSRRPGSSAQPSGTTKIVLHAASAVSHLMNLLADYEVSPEMLNMAVQDAVNKTEQAALAVQEFESSSEKVGMR